MANITKNFLVETGSIINWPYNSQSYYGFDTGPNLIYGTCRNAYFEGKDGNFYRIHACRWTGNDTNRSVYLRLDASHITSGSSYTSYNDEVFDSLIIGSTTLPSSSVNTFSFTGTGYVGFYWSNITTNPFSGNTTCSMEGVLTGPYGAEFSNSNGYITLSIVDRANRFVVASTSGSVPASGSLFVTVAGMQNNDSWNVFANISGTTGSISALSFSIAKGTGGFTINNNDSNSAHTYDYWVMRT